MTPRLSVKWDFEEEMGYYHPLSSGKIMKGKKIAREDSLNETR